MAKAQAHGTSRFTSRYTDQQKDAILRAVLIEQHTVAEAIELAQAGQLGVPAFTIGVYAYDIVKKGRDGFEADHEDALTLAVAKELKASELDALANLRAIRRGFTREGNDDTSALARATKDLTTIRRARKDATARIKTSAVANPNTVEGDVPAPQASVVTDLLAMTQEGARTGSLGRAPNAAA